MHARIEINPSICHGKPVIKGTRVLVANILGALAGGDSIEDVLEDYPNIGRRGFACRACIRRGALAVSGRTLRDLHTMRFFLDENFPKAARIAQPGRT